MKIITKNPTTTTKNHKKKSASTESKKKSKTTGDNNFWKAISSPAAIKAYGAVLAIFAIFAFISIFSYFFTHSTDLDFVEDNAEKAANWCSNWGAYVAYLFSDYTFGLFAIALPFLLFLYGVCLAFGKEILPLKHTTVTTLLTIAWLSMFTAIFCVGSDGMNPTSNFPAGAFGVCITGFLVQKTKIIGTLLILLALAFVILIVCYDMSTDAMADGAKLLFSKIKNGTKQEKGNGKNVKSKRKRRSNEHDDEEETDETMEKAQVQDLAPLYISSQGQLSQEYHNNVIEFENKPQTSQQPAETIQEVPMDIKGLDEEEPMEELHLQTINEEIQEEETQAESEYVEPPRATTPEEVEMLEDYDPRKDLSTYEFPTTDLLQDYGNAAIDKEEQLRDLREKKERIEETLNSFGISIERITATVGPTVTLYEIVPTKGVRISKIKNLEDDIALSLAALGIRIIAPIPGRGTIGIEVPNAKPQIVPMKDILNSDKFANSKYELPIGLGKTISNEAFVVDLAKMPHLLMAGATGQGKSVGLNAIIASLLYKKHPSELKFVLVDPKKVEFTLYSIIENHYLAMLPDSGDPIITDTKKVVNTLNSLCTEMDARYDLLKTAGVRNIKEYNAKFCQRKLSPANGHRFLPYIVLIIDEFGDLIMTAGREVETPIARLAQLARAIGIHLVIATQRPSVNIITGIIKANFPSRIAFRVTSIVDSRTILDSSGANQLIGKGDMLISTGSDLVRLQCAFIDTPEVEVLTRHIADQQGYPEPFLLPEYISPEDAGGMADEPTNPDSIDPCFMDAATLIVETQQGSTSLLQRRMRLGYSRAGRIMDQLEEFGIVGPSMGSKVREVKVRSNEELRAIFQKMGLL